MLECGCRSMKLNKAGWPKARLAHSQENRVGQAWRPGHTQVIGEDIFGNAKIFDLPDGHFQCHHCLTVVRIDERGFAACTNCGLVYNDGKTIGREPHKGRMSTRERKRLIYDCNHNKG